MDWLHGESILEAGMHHLEARFWILRCSRKMKARGINTMNRFNGFDPRAFICSRTAQNQSAPPNDAWGFQNTLAVQTSP